MKLRNKSTRDISVTDPFLERGVTVLAGTVGDFSEPAAVDLLASFPSDWEPADVTPTEVSKES